jgi:hypothetical protein
MGAKLVILTGAGSSVNYGFPLGRELFDHITGSAPVLREDDNLLRSIELDQHNQYRGQVASLRLGSIDVAARHIRESNPALFEWCKFKVAQAILQHEAQLQYSNHDDDWVRRLRTQLTAKLPPGYTPSFKDVSILTLNYDRVIEHLFYRGFAAVDEQKALAQLAALNVVHVHGSVGNYAMTTHLPHSIRFGTTLSGAICQAGSGLIRLYFEDLFQDKRVIAANAIAEAETFLVMGVGSAMDQVYPLIQSALERRTKIRFGGGPLHVIVAAPDMAGVRERQVQRAFNALQVPATLEVVAGTCSMALDRLDWDSLLSDRRG